MKNCWFLCPVPNKHWYFEIGANVLQPLSCILGVEFSVVSISREACMAER